MAAVLSEQEATEFLQCASAGIAVAACINSPSSVTISGDLPAIDELEAILKAEGKFGRKLRVQTAYHSHHMAVVAEDYRKSLEDIQILSPPKDARRMFSSVTGELISLSELDGSYWVRNMVSPVGFDAVKTLLTHTAKIRGRRRAIEYTAAIEIGPHEALKGPLQQILTSINPKLASSITYTSILRRGVDAQTAALEAAGVLWSRGVKIDLSAANQSPHEPSLKALSDLPAYKWNHTKG